MSHIQAVQPLMLRKEEGQLYMQRQVSEIGQWEEDCGKNIVPL